MKKILILAILFLSVEIIPQVENANTQAKGEPSYYQDILNFASDSSGMTRTDVFIQVPYNEVQFVLSGEVFVASYTLSVSIYSEEKEKLIVEKSWTEKLESKNFDLTTSRNNFNLSMRSFMLSPAKYVIRTSVDDKESSRNYVAENEFVVRDLSTPFAISDILILAKSDTVNDGNKILPNISRNISVSKTGIPIFMEVYSEVPRTVNIEYSILDEKQKVISQVFENQSVDTGTTRVFYTYKDTSLSLGTYTMYVAVKGEDGADLTKVMKNFTSRWAGIPFNINDLDKAIQQMVYIATEDELDRIEDSENKEEKIKRYLEFWKKKDPVPESEENEIFNEYYRRVDYSNKNFSHYSEGWKTDRGMVFIILGSPNNVERHPFDYNSKPYEIWEYYNINRSFIFVDETGFGDYRLVTPLYGDNYRFR